MLYIVSLKVLGSDLIVWIKWLSVVGCRNVLGIVKGYCLRQHVLSIWTWGRLMGISLASAMGVLGKAAGLGAWVSVGRLMDYLLLMMLMDLGVIVV